MRPQFYSWLFDDMSAWEKSLADPRYSYELPMDSFMSIYCAERRQDPNAMQYYAMPAMSSMPVMPAMTDPAAAAIFNAPLDVSSMVAAAAPQQSKDEKQEEGILSQDDIDALLSGL